MSDEVKNVVTGKYIKTSFSAFQNVFKEELEDEKKPGIFDNGKKEQLIDFFKNAGIKDELANEFIKRSEKLSSSLANLSKANSFGIPKNINEDEYKNLKADYDDFLSLCQNINYELPDEEFEKDDNLFSKVQMALYADIHIVNELADKHPEVPLELGFNNIKTRNISGSLAGSNIVGSVQNTRAVITIVDDYGNIRTGVYTPEKKITDDMIKHHSETTANQINIDSLKMQKGERIDSRNSAMYDVANLLGRPDLIAESMDVKIEHNGKKVEGNFMEFVNGTDLDHLTTDDPYSNINPKDYLTDNVKKDMLDLTIIDYLCLNVDRHSGNMIYQYGKDKKNVTRLTGIKGIDNDSSFGAVNPKVSEHQNRLQPMTSTVLITEGMAKKLGAMTHESLELILSKYNMNEDAIEAAKERLTMLHQSLKRGSTVSNNLQLLKTLRDKKAAGGALTEKEVEMFEALEGYFKGFEKNPIAFAQKRRCFNGQIDKLIFVPGVIVVPDDMIKSIDFDAMGKSTSLKKGPSGEVLHCGVIDNVTFEHNSQERKNFNMELANKNGVKGKKNVPNPELRIGGENINGASRNLGLENSTLLIDLNKLMISTKDKGLQPIVDEMIKIKTLSEKLGKEGYQPTDMEVNVLVGYIQSVKNECNKGKMLLGKKHSTITVLKAEHALLDKISNALDPMVSRIRSAQERDLLAFNVDMAKKAEAIQTGREAIFDKGFDDPEIERMLVRSVTSFESNMVQYSYAMNNIRNIDKKANMNFAEPFLNSLKELENISSEINSKEKPAIGDISKLRNVYGKAIEMATKLSNVTGKTPVEKQMINLAKVINKNLQQDKEIIDKFKPGDQRSFSTQYMDSQIGGRNTKELAVAIKLALVEDIYKLNEIDGNRKKASPEFKNLVNTAVDFLHIKEQDDLSDKLGKLEKSCLDYIAKHKGVAKNDLEQKCMDLAYGIKTSCNNYRTAYNVAQKLEQKELDKQVQAQKPEVQKNEMEVQKKEAIANDLIM